MADDTEDISWSVQSLASGDEPYQFWSVERISEQEARSRFDAMKKHAKENGGYYKLLRNGELKEAYQCSAEND